MAEDALETPLTRDAVARNGRLFTRTAAKGEYDHVFVSGCFRIFFALTGPFSPAVHTDRNLDSVPDYIENLAFLFQLSRILLNQSLFLKDPLREGILFDLGPPRFYDIFLQDIPFEFGMASERVYDQEYDFFAGTPFQGKALRIRVHRNLISRTTTPIHELFHLYQYNYSKFNNMWFMEGLAAWSQSLLFNGGGRQEKLPATPAKLLELLDKLHGAASFWNRLAALCDADGTLPLPASLQAHAEIINTRRTGGKLIRTVLENTAVQMEAMQREEISRDLGAVYWSEIESKSPHNNKYILQAVLDALSCNRAGPNREIDRFIEAAAPIVSTTRDDFNRPDIQRLMGVFQKCAPEQVVRSEQGFLYSEYYDIHTRTFSCAALTLSDPTLTDADLDALELLRHINGRLVITEINITSLEGLKNLETAHEIQLAQLPALERISGLNRLARVRYAIRIEENPSLGIVSGFTGLIEAGAVQIERNPHLAKITGFTSLERIRRGSLEITANPLLARIAGLGRLSEIKHTLLLRDCPVLSDVAFLSSLAKVRNIDIRAIALADGSPLAGVFRHNPHFWGHIKISSASLRSLGFMAGLKSVGSSLYVHRTKLADLRGLEKLERVGASFSLASNRLSDISQLSRLKEVHGALNLAANRLRTLNGLEGLRLVKTVKWNGSPLSLAINGNRELTDISALAGLGTAEPDLVITIDPGASYAITPGRDSVFCGNRLQVLEVPGMVARAKSCVCSEETESRRVILFSEKGPGWQAALGKHAWLHPYFLPFRDVDEIVSCCRKNRIRSLVAIDMASQLFLLKNKERLHRHSLDFLVNRKEVIDTYRDKQLFHDFMVKNGFGEYIPRHFSSPAAADYPCIVKPRKGSSGRMQRIARSRSEVPELGGDEILQEYFPGNIEYASNIFFFDDEVLCCNTYEKVFPREYYILGQVSRKTVVDRRCDTRFKEIFREILAKTNYVGICCFDYKIVGNKPKIFEVNARLGYTSVQGEFSSDLKIMLEQYLDHARLASAAGSGRG